MPEISGMIQQFLEGNIKTLSAEPVIESKTITENGTYTAPEGVDGYSPVVVNVPSDAPVIESKTITENGTYTPESGVDGFAPVVVNVQSTAPVIESKNITENGTYTAPAGVDGYTPVIVNVPLPQNAYLLKSVSNLPQPIASFNDGEDIVMPSLKVAIEPQQEGSGDPSPTNVRPISGWDKVNVTVTDDVNNPTVSNVYTIDLDGTRYGGEVDVVNGSGTDRLVYVDMGDINWNYNGNGVFYVNNLEGLKINGYAISSAYATTKSYPTVMSTDGTMWISDARNQLVVHNNAYSSASDFKQAMSGVQLVYELATPQTIQLTPTQVKSLLGSNNVWADTGDITDAEYFSKEV